MQDDRRYSQLRQRIYDVLWAPSVKSILHRVPFIRRVYNGWARQHPFDAEYGIDTSGVIAAADNAPAQMAARMSPYAGSQPSIVRASLAALPNHNQYAFIDLGCGKGRPLVLASEFPFRRIVGIEIAPALVEIAQTNAARVAAGHPDRTPIEVETGDATVVLPPGQNVVYYMYHPFDRSLVRALVDTIERQLTVKLQHAFFVYYNPVHGEVLDQSAHFSRWHADVVSYAPGELGYGPDLRDTVVIWQTEPARYTPLPRAGRPIVVDESGSNAQLGDQDSWPPAG